MGGVLRVMVRFAGSGRCACGGCGGGMWFKEERGVRLADGTVFNRVVRMVWWKRRWRGRRPFSSECGGGFVHGAGGVDISGAGADNQSGGAGGVFLSVCQIGFGL